MARNKRPEEGFHLRQFSPLRGGAGHALLDRVQDQLAAFLNPLAREVARLAESAGGAVVSRALPKNLGTPTSGTSDEASPSDHVHEMPGLNDLPGTLSPSRGGTGLPGSNALADVLTGDGSGGWLSLPVAAGGLINFIESLKTTYSRPIVSLIALNAGADVDVALTPKGTGALTAQAADGGVAGGNQRGYSSVDLQLSRNAADQVAALPFSFLGGGARNKIQGIVSASYNVLVGGFANIIGVAGQGATYNVLVGGQQNNLGYRYGRFLGGGRTNTITGNGDYDVLVGGRSNRINSYQSTTQPGGSNFLGGGYQNNIDSPFGAQFNVLAGGELNKITSAGQSLPSHASIGGGKSNTIEGSGTIPGGSSNLARQGATVAGQYNEGRFRSAIPGGRQAFADRDNMFAFASGQRATKGDAQFGLLVQRETTTNDTPTTLSQKGNTVGAKKDLCILPNNQVFAIRAQVTAREISTGDVAVWEITGAAKRGANAASTAIIGTPTVTLIAADAGAASWTCGLVANTTYGAAVIEAAGEAGKTIAWVATMQTTECG